MKRFIAACSLLLLLPASAIAEEPAAALSVKDLAAKVRPAIVVISHAGREGNQQGLGTGFIIDKRGLVATNLHVIGEARPISIEMSDGKIHNVTAVEAYDRNLDLAVIRIDAKDLPALPLGDSSTLKQGQPVVAGRLQGVKQRGQQDVQRRGESVDAFPRLVNQAMPLNEVFAVAVSDEEILPDLAGIEAHGQDHGHRCDG